MKLVKVVWDDAVGSAEWEEWDNSHPHRPVRFVSVGWLVHVDEASLTLYTCFEKKPEPGEKPVYGGRTTLPMGMVRSITELKVKNGRKFTQA